MIACLPSSPWARSAASRRIDWMISLSLRSIGPVAVLDELRVQEPCPDELLGDRRGAAAVAAQRVEPGGDDRHRVEAGVLPERLVLDRGRRVEQDRRDLLEGHDLALELAEAGQLDLAGPVVEDRLLGQRVVRSARPGRRGRWRARHTPTAPRRRRGCRRAARNAKTMMRDPADGRSGAGGGSLVDRVGLRSVGVGHRAQACRIARQIARSCAAVRAALQVRDAAAALRPAAKRSRCCAVRVEHRLEQRARRPRAPTSGFAPAPGGPACGRRSARPRPSAPRRP